MNRDIIVNLAGAVVLITTGKRPRLRLRGAMTFAVTGPIKISMNRTDGSRKHTAKA